ncbi:hypothetical protein EST38_g8065 [Candolleomyces aberdarensis]|uniref:Uncharacterized protein n=1 Tax=Candolleomyces aberdarensis TaxID=2316362 RepID=A0A4V1Q393_9AGAR|nr:hypothetical protein EST38_g8065 [Candolleomyces aberdarensis]
MDSQLGGAYDGSASNGPTTSTATSTLNATTATATTTGGAATDSRTWSISANFPNVEKVINSSITREQFMAHAGELAKRLTHQLQGRLPPERMEFVQALLQPPTPSSSTGSSLPTPLTAQQQQAMIKSASGGDDQGLVGGGVIIGGSAEADLLGSVAALVEQHHQHQQSQQQQSLPVYGPPPPPPPALPDAKFDLDAVFAAGFEAGLAGAVNGFDPFDDCGAREGDEDDEDDGDDRDYHDHLRQPGNTKKRKVPANTGSSPQRISRGDEGDELDPGGLGGGQQAADGGIADGGTGNSAGGGGEGTLGAGTEAFGGRGTPYPGGGYGGTQFPIGRLPLSALSTFTTTCPSAARVGQLKSVVRVRGKLVGAMVAGIQHKEMLKARKRQLAAVMGVLSQGDTLALDQALSMVGNTGPFGGPLSSPSSITAPGSGVGTGRFADEKENQGEEQKAATVRLSRRTSARMARAVVRTMKSGGPRQAGALPSRKFSFACDSATKERLIATKEEVTTLRKRFEAELERQAANAAKLAAASKSQVGVPNTAASTPAKTGTKPKKTKTGGSPSKNKSSQGSANPQGKGTGNNGSQPASQQQQQLLAPVQPKGAQTQQAHHPGSGGANQQRQQAPQSQQHYQQQQQQHQQPLPSPPASSPPLQQTKPKKKKRSALANASNPHHLRNYVPSRLPHSAGGGGSLSHGGPNGVGNSVNNGLLGPLPLRFLTAELPAKKGTSVNGGGGGTGGKKQKGSGGSNAGSNAANNATHNTSAMLSLLVPGDEWICAFCEYDLFFGDDVAFRKAVRSRKKILKRRRRARERAAAAANGVKTFGKGGAAAAPASANSPSGPHSANGGANGAAGPPSGMTGHAPVNPNGVHAVNGKSGRNPSSANAVNHGEEEGSDEDCDFDLADFDDGDPGYEAGGNGKDAFGNVPKYQTKGKAVGGHDSGQLIPAAG